MNALYKKRFFDLNYFCRRFGAKELFLVPIRKAISPFVILALRNRTFKFGGNQYSYFYKSRFITWANERCVEIAACLPLLAKIKPQNILEVGNVFSQFFEVKHAVLDKYQQSPIVEVVNEDICTVNLQRKFQLIVSISTLEHVGFDEGDETIIIREKIKMAFENCLRHLEQHGTFIVTLPIAYNPVMDEMIREKALGIGEEFFLQRTSYSTWQECSRDQALSFNYGRPYPWANALYIGLHQNHNRKSLVGGHGIR